MDSSGNHVGWLNCTDSPDGKVEKSSYKITNVLLIKD